MATGLTTHELAKRLLQRADVEIQALITRSDDSAFMAKVVGESDLGDADGLMYLEEHTYDPTEEA